MKPQLADDDAAQHQEILERLRRLENAVEDLRRRIAALGG